MPKKRNSRKKSIQNVQSIGCPHLHTHTLPQFGISTCFSCLMIYHNGCEYRKIEDSKEAIQSIKILKTHLDDIRVTADVNRLHIQFKNNFDELSVFSSELDSLSKRLEVAIQQNNSQEFVEVKEAALKLMQKLDNSEMMAVYAKHWVHSLLDRRVNGISKTELKSCSNKLNSNENTKHLENEEWDSTHEETKDDYKDDYFMLIESYGTKYRDLEAKVKTLDKAKKELESKVNSFEEYKKEAEEKCKKLDTEIADSKKLNDENTKKIEGLKEG